jgi:hypothetical protein
VDEEDAVSRQSKRWLRQGQSGSYLARYGPFPALALPDNSVKPIRFTSAMAFKRTVPALQSGLDDEARWALAPGQLLTLANLRVLRVLAWPRAVMRLT